jgi:hypothetical protein
MSDPPRRLIEIGVLPTGYADTFVAGGVDPVAAMIADAIRKDDLAKAEAERIRLAAIADIERARRTRAARSRRRLTRVLRSWLR